MNVVPSKYDFAGNHILGELYGVDYAKINSIDFLVETITCGMKKGSVTCEGMLVKKFDTQGVTILAMLSESHISIHTYPEHQALFFDIFTCGTHCDCNKILDTFLIALCPQKTNIVSKKRGTEI